MVLWLCWILFFNFLDEKRYQKEKKYLILHGWKSREQIIRGIWKWELLIAFIGDRTSGSFLIIASVSDADNSVTQTNNFVNVNVFNGVTSPLVLSYCCVLLYFLTMPVGFNHCAPPNISRLFTRSEQVHCYSTRFSVAGSLYIKQGRTNHQLLSFSRVGAKIWNGIPSELRKLRKASFKRKLTHLLLKILETEKMNVDMCFIDLSSFPAFSLTC